jgi:hypothetical protein
MSPDSSKTTDGHTEVWKSLYCEIFFSTIDGNVDIKLKPEYILRSKTRHRAKFGNPGPTQNDMELPTL